MSTVLHMPCDEASAKAAKSAAPAARPSLLLWATILASSLAFVDGSAVNVGLPAIGRSLSVEASALQNVISIYLLPLSALLLIGGALGDRYGRRRILIAGIGVFAGASLLCAAAPNLLLLLTGRFLQGVGAALLMPNSLAILGSAFSGEAKGQAIGFWAATGAVLGAAGPVLGGWLIDTVSWRAVFVINLPLALIATGLAVIAVPADHGNPEEPLDGLGGALATVALGALTWALTLPGGSDGWTLTAAALAGLALAAFAGLLTVEARRGSHAMMPLTLFASRSFIGLTLLTLFLYGALGALQVLIPYVLIEASGYSGVAAGAALLPIPVVLAVSSPYLGRLAARSGPRLPLSLGALGVGLGFLLALRIDGSSSYWTNVLPAMLVIAVGLSGAVAPLTTAVLSSVDAVHTGSASGFNSAIARTGGLIATALLGPVLTAHGSPLISAFHDAMTVGAAVCGVAALSAYVLLPPSFARGINQSQPVERAG